MWLPDFLGLLCRQLIMHCKTWITTVFKSDFTLEPRSDKNKIQSYPSCNRGEQAINFFSAIKIGGKLHKNLAFLYTEYGNFIKTDMVKPKLI